MVSAGVVSAGGGLLVWHFWRQAQAPFSTRILATNAGVRHSTSNACALCVCVCVCARRARARGAARSCKKLALHTRANLGVF